MFTSELRPLRDVEMASLPVKDHHHTPVLHITKVNRYDVVILGGGIAGIAIAELLSRKADLQILVLERTSQLGMGSSGRLEGWYHTGALYAGLQDPQIFMNCINGLEDLYNLYRIYKRCNIGLEPNGENLVPKLKGHHSHFIDRWFNPHYVTFILRMVNSPDCISTPHRQFDRYPLWQQQKALLITRLRYCLSEHNSQEKGNACRASSLQQVQEAWNGHRENLTVRDVAMLQASSTQALLLNTLCRHYSGTEPACEFLQSSNVSMNTEYILTDLVASALSFKCVKFETSVALEDVFLSNQRHVKTIVYQRSDGAKVHVKAELFILSDEAGNTELTREHLFLLNKRVKKVSSAMVVVKPALAQINFVRMALDSEYYFNYFYREFYFNGIHHDYSLLADSGYIADKGELSSRSAERILEQAERFFGRNNLFDREIYEYACVKTEFGADAKCRQYSYWIKPMALFQKEPIRILIIEDDQDWVEIIQEILPGDFQFDCASTVAEVKALLQKNVYDLIIADLLLSVEENHVFGIFKDFSNLIFTIKQTKLDGKLWPPIIVVTVNQIPAQMPKLLNHCGGWIWGWHDKQEFDINTFHHNVEATIATKETFEKNMKMPDEWTIRHLLYVLSHMTLQGWATITGIIGFLLTLSYYVGVWTA